MFDSNSGTGSFGLPSSGLEERLYALQDPNWNVVAIADVAGAVQERYTYTAYGEPAFFAGLFGSRSVSECDWQTLYCGYRWDAQVSSYHVRNRDVWSHIGRWDHRDPVDFEADEMNLYQYVLNNPLVASDPVGLRAPPLPPPTCPPPSIQVWTWVTRCTPWVGRCIRLSVVFCYEDNTESRERIEDWLRRKRDTGQCACGYKCIDHRGNEFVQ